MPSAVPTARRWLLDQLTVEFSADDADVAFPHPTREAPASVVLTGYLDTAEEWAAIGAGRRTETFELQVLIVVARPSTGDPFEVEDLVLGYADRVTAVVMADITMGGAVYNSIVAGRSGLGDDNIAVAAVEGGGYGGQIDVRIACQARIT